MEKLNELKIKAYTLYNSREMYKQAVEKLERDLQNVLNEIIAIEKEEESKKTEAVVKKENPK